MESKRFFTTSSDLVCVLDKAGLINDVNNELCAELGWTQKELFNKSIQSLIPDEADSLNDKIKSTLDSGNSCKFNRQILKKDGSSFSACWVLEQAKPGLLSLVGRKIRDSRSQKNRDYLELATNIARVGYGHLDLDSKRVSWSETACSIFGVKASAHIDSYDFFFHLFDHEDRPLILAKHEEAIETQAITEFQTRISKRNSAKDCFVHVHILSELNAQNEPSAFFYVLKDITDYENARHMAEKATAELNYQATHDELTGLGNRRVFDEALNRANEHFAKKGRKFALCIVDLDQFKIINDTCGHEAGDNLLQQVASLLLDMSGKDSLVVRLGGDEFGIFLYDMNIHQASELAEKIREGIDRQTFRWNQKVFRLGASIGLVSVTQPVESLSEITRAADCACISAKEAGRNSVRAVQASDESIQGQQQQMSWVQRIYEALEQDDFILYSQPIISLASPQDVVWEEILLRLRDRETGRIISPGAFLPAAERYGLSSRIDHWVARQLIKTLQAYGHLFKEERIYWLNLSGRSICDANFIDFLVSEIHSANLKPGTLNFEITEAAVVSNISEAADVINRLKQLGCRFALDDFGSGITSFSYLKNLPVDWIKIDGSFVKNIHKDEVDRLFVKSIIDISKVMGMKCVAEFIESDEILESIREMGADFGQGYALGKPSELLPIPAMKANPDLSY